LFKEITVDKFGTLIRWSKTDFTLVWFLGDLVQSQFTKV